ncbi:MAG TPA: ABC transporter ATP-binding protein, partial [Terriglobia bacterium]|nr:ABC transporter ATP-binding protein [Terriglobia bacterium]
SLLDFQGAVVLVTHDRLLLDQVSTHVLALDSAGHATPYADSAQWEADRPRREAATSRPAARRDGGAGASSPTAAGPAPKPARRRLSYHEQREWDEMEGRITAAEAELAACQEAVVDPAVATVATALAERCQSLEVARAAVERLYSRWAELEAKKG